MNSKTSERRMAENEVYFRTQNEKLQKSIDEVNEIAKEVSENQLEFGNDTFLFRCECSNEDCDDRIEVTLNEYKKAHEKRNTFLIRKGHQVPEIETIAKERSGYYLVTKNIDLPAKVEHLNATSL